MAQLHETNMGRKLIEGTLPSIARSLERLVDSLDKLPAAQTYTHTWSERGPSEEPDSIIIPQEVEKLLEDAVQTDGDHHKQWYLEQIAQALCIDLPKHEEGIAP